MESPLRLIKIILLVLIVVSVSGCTKQRTHTKPTLRVVMGLAEVEWQVMRDKIFPVFEERYSCTIEAYQVESSRY